MAARSRAADTLLAAALVLLLAQAHGRSLQVCPCIASLAAAGRVFSVCRRLPLAQPLLPNPPPRPAQEDLVAPAPTADAAPAPAPAPLDGVSVDTGLMALDGVWPLDEIDPCWDDFNNCDSTNCFEYSAYSRNADPVAYNNCLNDCERLGLLPAGVASAAAGAASAVQHRACLLARGLTATTAPPPLPPCAGKAPYNACYPKQEKCTPPFELCKATLCSAASLDPGPQPQPPAGGFNSTEQMSAYVDAVQAWAFKVTLLPATTAACVDTCACHWVLRGRGAVAALCPGRTRGHTSISGRGLARQCRAQRRDTSLR